MNKRLSAKLTGIVIIGAMALSEGCGTSHKEPETSAITSIEDTLTSETSTEELPPVDELPKVITTTFGELDNIGNYCPAENLTGRAPVAIPTGNGTFVSWRSLDTDSSSTEYVVSINGNEIYKGNKTSFVTNEISPKDVISLSVANEPAQEFVAWHDEYLELKLNVPDYQTMPDKSTAIYAANDCSVGDLDGDGDLELIVKWYPSNAQDNSKDGYTGTTFLDGYDVDFNTGETKLLWRIDLGLNIRSGAHYTQFQVWDYNGDGKAEILCKSADGTTTYDSNLNETGHVGEVSMSELDISAKGKPENFDFRQHDGRIGRIVLGQEYLTAFNGLTGEIIDTVKYIPERGPWNDEKGRYDTSEWGLKNGYPAEKNDGYANRADRFLAGTAYLDDGSPSAIFARGYYGRTAITAWKLIDNKLCMQWAFDIPADSEYAAQGNHNLSINDVDGDGYDEIVYGSLCLDNDGSILYSTGLGHGDAMHVSDFNNDGKLEVFQVHEDTNSEYLVEMHDALTGKILWGYKLDKDTGRGLAADIDPRYDGAECWSAVREAVYDCNGNVIYTNRPSINFSLYWDGDLLEELFDSNNSEELIPQIQKWDYENEKTEVLLEATDCVLNNGTKSNPCIIADLIGDWREEVLVRSANDPSILRLYSTCEPTDYVFTCLMFDRTYREAIAWQNTVYNQPAHLPNPLRAEQSK